MNLYGKLTLKAALALALSLGALACGDDDDGGTAPNPDGGAPLDGGGGLDATQPPAPDAGTDATTPPDGEQKPVASIYAYLVHVPNADGGLDFYVAVTRSPDFSSIDLSKARQVPAYSGMMVVDGFVFIGQNNGPFIYKYKVEDNLSLTEVAKIDFGAYPLTEGETLNFYASDFISSTLAAHHVGLDKAQRVLWNPATGKIIQNVTESQLPEFTATEGIAFGGNRTEMNFWKGTPARAWLAATLTPPEYPTLPTSYIATWDKTTGAEKAVLRIDNCRGLAQSTEDEQGNQYFSPTHPFLAEALYNKGAATCVVKLKADGTLDSGFGQTDLTKYLSGNYGINLRYIKNNKATVHVLHKDRVAAKVNLSAATVDPNITKVLREDPTVWELAVIDLSNGTSKEFTGFAAEDDVGHYGRQIKLNGKTFFVAQRKGSYAMYELDVDNAKATFVTTTPGEIWSAFPVR